MIDEAVEAIRSGQLIGIPTDTVYGLGVDPTNREAVARLFAAKARAREKPIGLLVSDLSQAKHMVEMTPGARRLAELHWPGGLTLVLNARAEMAPGVGDDKRGTVGLRVPDHQTALTVLKRTGPLAVTSANLSGESESWSDEGARALFGDIVSVYVEGECPGGQASTVVDATGDSPIVLREGPIAI